MKRTAVFGFALLLLAATAAAQVSASDLAAIRAVLDAQAAAWNRGDIDAYMAGFTQ